MRDHTPDPGGDGQLVAKPVATGRPLRMLQYSASREAGTRIEAFLRRAGLSVRMRQAEDTMRFQHYLVHDRPDIVVIEDAAGLDVRAVVRMARVQDDALPVIVISDGMDDEAAADLMKCGASAYLRREHLGGVVDAVRTALSEAERLRQHHALEARNAELARTDPLTGLPNRAAFIAALRRAQRDFAVFYLDFDYFSDVNDSLGHPAGDALLCAAAERLGASLRGSDMVARLGGDEFAILQTSVRDPADCGALASRLQASLAAPFDLGVAQRAMTVSIGIAMCDRLPENAADIMSQADIALYRAKETGRNRFCFYSRDIDSTLREQQLMSEELGSAMAQGQFELYFAPQAASDSRQIVAVEALTMWHHPRRGLLLSDAYFPIAERTGTMPAIAAWALDETCRHIAQWRAEGIQVVPVVVRLCRSHHQASGCISERLAAILARWDIPPELLVLSFSEEAFIEVTRSHAEAVSAIAEAGIGLAIDTFGQGHMPFALLRDFRVSRIKIDASPNGIARGAKRDLVLIAAVAAMAAVLGISLVVDGVTSEAEAAAMIAAGRPVLQGAAIGEPAPPDMIAGALRANAVRHG